MTRYVVKPALKGFFYKWKSTGDMTSEPFKRVNTNLYVRSYDPSFTDYMLHESGKYGKHLTNLCHDPNVGEEQNPSSSISAKCIFKTVNRTLTFVVPF
jgi:alpha-N-acetylglucosamine transferase